MIPTTTYNTTTTRFPAWFKLLRVGLGLVLIWKGLHFLLDTYAVQYLLGRDIAGGLTTNDAVVIVVLSAFSLLFGTFILIGKYTRFAALVQLPVFLVGTLFIHAGHIERRGFELVLTAAVPFLLLVLIAQQDSVATTKTKRKYIRR